jgi:hypothetical protein
MFGVPRDGKVVANSLQVSCPDVRSARVVPRIRVGNSTLTFLLRHSVTSTALEAWSVHRFRRVVK